MSPKIFLTFDCEDFINTRSILALHAILELLNEYNLRGLFFLTGHMAEKISNFPKILDLLEDETIGYHSSSHSVRPTIVEYTDLKDYTLARRISVEKETSHINPLTGEPEREGGILVIKELFPNNGDIPFRAPAFGWSPPHMEALKEFGIQFDFSAKLSPTPISHKGITFYPSHTLIDTVNLHGYVSVFRSLARFGIAVLNFHPNQFVNLSYWDSIYFSGNPKRLYPVQRKSWKDTKADLRTFELLLKRLSRLEKTSALEITPDLEKSGKRQSFAEEHALKSYRDSIRWAKDFLGFSPKFIKRHFMEFFDIV